ncbi:hypothetical protein [Streptomyces sp. NPDC001851]|uniref:hypothetical protein n=1 Tax=Streptomyces sp. NPDC001851 TaxID=3154529 RepID=UPI003330C577
MPQGGYTETIADPHLLDLHSKDLVQVAELAGRVIRRTHCPVYQLVRTIGEAVDELLEMHRQGNTDVAKRHAELLLPIMRELLDRLERPETGGCSAT